MNESQFGLIKHLKGVKIMLHRFIMIYYVNLGGALIGVFEQQILQICSIKFLYSKPDTFVIWHAKFSNI